MTRAVKVVNDEEEPIAVEVLAQSIVEIAAAMKKINATRLTRRALVYLIHMNSKIGIGTIEIVLNNLDALEDNYLRKEKRT